MRNKHVLLTGGLGFIGSHTVEHWLANTDWDITVLDSLRFAGRVDRLVSARGYDPDRVRVLWHDLRAPLHDALVYDIGDVDFVVNMAADSHVDRSISDPVPFIHNNVMSAVNMLEYARIARPDAFVQISTDEVYGPAPGGYSHVEWDVPLPSNPYSASKASQEQVAFAYWRTFGVPVVITNTMNNFGEKQHPEKYVPMVVRNVLNDVSTTVHGVEVDGEWRSGSRVWLHARNHADALMFILNEVPILMHEDGHDRPVRFNIAGDVELSNLEILERVGDILGKQVIYDMEDFHSSRPGHDLRYSLSGAALRDAGWAPPVSFDESFERTVRWYEKNPSWLYG